MEPGKRYTKVVDSPFHISAAVLDTTTQDHGIVRVVVDVGDTEALIANLSLKHGILQFPLDLQFDSGSRISFYTSGAKSNVHLSGYVTYEEEIFSGDDDGSSEDEEIPMLVSAPAKRKPEENPSPGNKKAKLQKVATPDPKRNTPAKPKATLNEIVKAGAVVPGMEEEKDSDEEEDDEEDWLDESDEGEEEEEDEDEDGEEEEDEDDDEEEDGVEDEEEDSDDEEEITEAVVNKQKTAAKPGLFPTKEPANVFKNEKTQKTAKDAKTPKGAKTPGSEANKTPKSAKSPGGEANKTPKSAKTPGGEAGAPNKAKKTPNKPQGANTNTPTQNGKTPKAENAIKNEGKSPKTPKVVKAGGVVCEDLVVGKGPEAKSGKMVSVYYVGCLASNKVFDKCDSGKGFKFRLGGGEVIKGWDVGVSGMRIGGKRKIVCPPHMAYGKKGAPPDIPGNASLTFTVELKGIN